MILGRYSMGIGDRFGKQGEAQLSALMQAGKSGEVIVPVWNKSNREHEIIGTNPGDVRIEADAAVKAVGWDGEYHVDADHIGLGNVDGFIDASDFFTLDVAESIGEKALAEDVERFVAKHEHYAGKLSIPGIERELAIDRDDIARIAGKFLLAVQEAGRIYRRIVEGKGGAEGFVTEVSMDESDEPQTPTEMFFILAAIADEGIPAQTIAPKFSGRFNKGVDYVGEVAKFSQEFEEDVLVIKHAVSEFGLPSNLKLSVHSGSDKFSIYGVIGDAIRKHDAGLHLKTAGTTWLEELIGLAMAGGAGLDVAKDVYAESYARFDELCVPYATVIDIERKCLPQPEEVQVWAGDQYVEALRHDQDCAGYDKNVRQLLHVGYKVAAEMGDRYFEALAEHRDMVSRNVSENIMERHAGRIFC